MREIVEWRLAEYLQRPSMDEQGSDRIVCRVLHSGGTPILKLPDRTKVPGISSGWVDVTVDEERCKANFVKMYINVIRRGESDDNVLGDIMRRWFGPNAGLPGTCFEVAFERKGDVYRMLPNSLTNGKQTT